MQRPHLYQIVHTRNYSAPQLSNHCQVLEYYFGRLYGVFLRLDKEDVAQRLSDCLHKARVLENLSTHVELRLYSDKTIEVSILQTTIYEGFALRCYSPFAVCVSYELPFGDMPTSARRAVSEWAHHAAQQQGGDISLRMDMEGVVHSCGEYPLFGVRSGHIFAAPASQSVERSMAISAIQRCGYQFVEEPILRQHLAHFDELFYVDAYGVTAIAQFEHRLYMSVVAERVAQNMG